MPVPGLGQQHAPAVVAVDAIGPLSSHEVQVIHQMRHLSQVSREWKLTLTMHPRKEGSYLQIEPTPYLKVVIHPDQFLAVE